MVKISNLSEEQIKELQFTDEEKRQLDEAKRKPLTYDDDCPAVTPEKAVKFKRVNPPRRINEA
ncbi:MAG: hypothetical protein IJJ64_15460 [Butyrivibrio sp.]|nr:hypothetical protein [Butyrivibrio sp.]